MSSGKRFAFWGGIIGISKQAQQEFYAAVGRDPEQVFPLRFRAEARLTNGLLPGQGKGFYRRTRDGVDQVERAKPEWDSSNVFVDLLQMEGAITSGYPQPESVPGYRDAVYSESCPRCGIYGPQKVPF